MQIVYNFDLDMTEYLDLDKQYLQEEKTGFIM